MEELSPQLIAIAGGSCAGKSWLAERLQKRLGKMAGRLSLDEFYLDRSHLPPGRREKINFDHPRAIDWARVEKVLTELKGGRPAAVPKYNFNTHGRQADETVLPPAPIVIIEGLWLWKRPTLRSLYSCRIFLRSSLELCEQRRLDRDVRERGRNSEFVKMQFWRDTVPMYERHVAPQERWADLVLDKVPGEAEVGQIAQRIQNILINRKSSHE